MKVGDLVRSTVDVAVTPPRGDNEEGCGYHHNTKPELPCERLFVVMELPKPGGVDTKVKSLITGYIFGVDGKYLREYTDD